MLFSINFVFLLSLGFLSWTILCYFNKIEQYILDDSNKTRGIPIGYSTMSEQIIPSNNKALEPRDNYELYVNFFCFFVCIYALAKITYLAETYMSKSLHRKLYEPSVDKIDLEYDAFDAFDNLHIQQKNLFRKISKLKKLNRELKYKLNKAKDIKGSPKTLEDNINKIFISNRHIHLNRQVCVNKRDVNMQFQIFQDTTENGNDIWQKYLKMQNSSHQNPVSLQTNDEMGIHKPVILSNEMWNKYLKMTNKSNEIATSSKTNNQKTTSLMTLVLTHKQLNYIQALF